MTDLRFTPDNADLETRVRRLVARQLSTDAFEVKLTDRIDEDLRLAGMDVTELLEKIVEEFGTDFSDLNIYWDDYFYPEVADFRGQASWLFLIASPVVIAILLHEKWPGLFSWWRLSLLFMIVVAGWVLIQRHRNATHGPHKVQMTVGELVEAVKTGKWTPPKDIDRQICRLRQRQSPI